MADFIPGQLIGGAAAAPHRGAVGSILHVLGKTAKNLEDVAINSPGALIRGGEDLATHPIRSIENIPHLSKLIAESTLQDFEHPLRKPGYTLLDALGVLGGVGGIAGRAASIGGIVARDGALPAELATAEDAARLGRSAQYTRTINPVTGKANSVGRQVAHTLLRGVPQEERLIPLGNEESQHGWWYSKNPAIRSAQKLVDELHARFPEVKVPLLWRDQAGRIQSAAKATNLQTSMNVRSAGNAYLKLYGKKPDAEHLAVRMVAEGTTAAALHEFHSRLLGSGALNAKMMKEIERREEILPQAAEYLHEVPIKLSDESEHIVPQVKPEYSELQKYVEDSRNLSKLREDASQEAGILNYAAAYDRIVNPRNYVLHGQVPKQDAVLKREAQQLHDLGHHEKANEIEAKLGGQLSMEDLDPSSPALKGPLAQELAEKAGLFRVPYKVENSPLSFGSTAFKKAWKGGPPKLPSTYTHAYKAGVLAHGGGDLNTAKLLAESYTEAHRFLGFRAVRQKILASAQDTPKGIPPEYRRLIRTNDPAPKGMTPLSAKAAEAHAYVNPESALLNKSGSLSHEEAEQGGRLYEGMRQHFFPTIQQAAAELGEHLRGTLHHGMTGDGEFQKVPGYKWVDSRTLGGLDKANPLAQAFTHPVPRTMVRLWDAVNAAQKQAVLYLKPAYLIPNGLGNLALNLVQQGFLAPLNLARSVFSFHLLDTETREAIKAAMGGGLSDALKPRKDVTALITKGGNKLASGYGKLIDDPFRFASFLHEAASDGFISPEELKILTHDPKFADQFSQIANRANDEIINYERLGPGEQAIMRRLIFFYPWVKGSTRYASMVGKNHPLATGFMGQTGKSQTQENESVLGNVPIYAQGIFPSGKVKHGMVNVQNPGAFSILGTPADLAEKATALISHHPNTDAAASEELAPTDQALLDLLTAGKSGRNGQAVTEPVYMTALHDLFGGNPIHTLYKNLSSHTKPNAIYGQQTRNEALSRFGLFGGLTDRPYNISKGQYIAYLEKHPRK